MFKIYFINFGYYSSEQFYTIEEAIRHAKSKSFECTIERNGEAVCSWSVISGIKYWR